MQIISRKDPKPISKEDAFYITGFVDGEGVLISLSKSEKTTLMEYKCPSFNISQRKIF